MIPIDFPERNCIYTADKCLPLPVCVQNNEQFNTYECISCFEFTDDEIVMFLKQIKAGQRPAIFLSVIGGQPPIAMWGERMNIVEVAENVWKAQYQQEPVQIIDCNNCEHISVTEMEQRKRGNQYPHICQCYMKRCKHNIVERGAVFIYPCEECVADGYKNFRGEL